MINLVVPRQEAKDRLEDRVAQGKKLLNEPIASELELDQVEGKFNKWSDYNARLLEIIFSDRSEADKYRASVALAVGLPVDKQIELFRMSVSGRIRKLESYIEQLELIPIADDVSSLHSSPERGERTANEHNETTTRSDG